RMGQLYAEIMQTTPDLVGITIRDLGEGSVWHAGLDAPVPAAVLSLEVRRGRPPEQRARLASALVDACTEALGLNPAHFAVEFTQHAGDESYRKLFVGGVLYGALGRDWTPDEASKPLFETMKDEARRKAL
ncbi:MAG: hypothetical protein WBD95_29535, partial [Xanthobacteraceae bacterium]